MLPTRRIAFTIRSGNLASKVHWATTSTLLVLLIICSLTAAHNIQAQPDSLSHASTVSLVTIQPGSPIYSKWGHSAINIFDPANNLNVNFNFGTFEFDDPLFVPKFVQGELNYYLSANQFEAAARHYESNERRSIIVQKLALTQEQRQSVYAFLLENIKPQNKYYRYDFLYDNCSTRIRDVFLQSVPAISFPENRSTGRPIRSLIRDYGKGAAALDIGMQLLLGADTNKDATNWVATFLPDSLMEFFDESVIESGGGLVPLVAQTDTVYWSGRESSAVNWLELALWLFGLVVSGLMIKYRSNTIVSKVARVVTGLAGIAGILILYMWLGTRHAVTQDNPNILWAFPLHVVAAALWRKRAAKPYFIFALVICSILTLGLFLGTLRISSSSIPLALLTAASLFVGLHSSVRMSASLPGSLPDSDETI